MADGRAARTLLDRLIDEREDPARGVVVSKTERQLKAEFKRALCRDLEALLNTRRPCTTRLGGIDPLIARSLLNYGIPDPTCFDMCDKNAREEFRGALERAIALFEPRLANPRVRLIEDQPLQERSVHLEIRAMLRAQPGLELCYDSYLKAGTSQLKVVEAER